MPQQRSLKSLLDDQSQTFKGLSNAPQSARSYLIRNGFGGNDASPKLTPEKRPQGLSTLSPKPPAIAPIRIGSPRADAWDENKPSSTAARVVGGVMSPTGASLRRPITPEPATPVPGQPRLPQTARGPYDHVVSPTQKESMALAPVATSPSRSALSHPRVTNSKLADVSNELFHLNAIGARTTAANDGYEPKGHRTNVSAIEGKLLVSGNERVLMPNAATFRPPALSQQEEKMPSGTPPTATPSQSPLPDLKSPFQAEPLRSFIVDNPMAIQAAAAGGRPSVYEFTVHVMSEDASPHAAAKSASHPGMLLLGGGPNFEDMPPPSMYTSYAPSEATSRRGTTLDSQWPVPIAGTGSSYSVLGSSLAVSMANTLEGLRELQADKKPLPESLRHQLAGLAQLLNELTAEPTEVPKSSGVHETLDIHIRVDNDGEEEYTQMGTGTMAPTAEHSTTVAAATNHEPIVSMQDSANTDASIPLAYLQELDATGRSAAAPEMSNLNQALNLMEDFLQAALLPNCQTMHLWRYDDKRLMPIDTHPNGITIPVSKSDRIKNRSTSEAHNSTSGASSGFMEQSIGSAEQSISPPAPLSEAHEDIRQAFLNGRIGCTKDHLLIPLPDSYERKGFKHWGVLEIIPTKGTTFAGAYRSMVPRLVVFGNQLRSLVLHYDQRTKNAKTSEAMKTVVSIAHSLAHNDVLDENKFIHTILESARSVCEAERASLFTLSGDDGSGNWTDLVARSKNGREFRVPRGKGIVGRVAETGSKLNIPDAQRSNVFFDSIDDKTGYVTRSILCVPVKFEGTLVGVAQLINKVGGHAAPSRGTTAGVDREGSASSSSSMPWEAIKASNRRQPLPKEEVIGFTVDDEERFDNMMTLLGLCLRSCTTENELTRERAKMEGLFASVLTLAQADLTDMAATKGQVLAAGKELASTFNSVYLLMVNKEHNKLELDPTIVSHHHHSPPSESADEGPTLLAMAGIAGQCVRTGEVQFVKNFGDTSQFRSSSAAAASPAPKPPVSIGDSGSKSVFQSQISSATSPFMSPTHANLFDPNVDAIGCEYKQLISIMCIPISAGSEVIAVLQLVALDIEGSPFVGTPTDGMPAALSAMGFGSISAQFAMSIRGFGDVINMSSTGDIIVSKLIDDKAKTNPSPEFISLMKGFALFAGIWLRNADLMAFTIRASKAATRLTEFTPGANKKDTNLILGGAADPLAKSTVNHSEVQILLKYPIPQEFLEQMKTPQFDLWSLRRRFDNPTALASSIVLKLMLSTGLPEKFGCQEETLAAFIVACRRKYRSVPYHSFFHAVDVLQTMYTFLYAGRVCDRLSDLEQFVMLIVALTHDLDHMGLNNSYYMKTESPLGILNAAGGNTSVLEVHHCNLAIDILSHQDCNVFEGLGKEDLQAAYRLLIEAILQTDMAKHAETVNHLKGFEPASFDLASEEHRRFAAITLMKAADISNVTKPFAISKQWGKAVVEEFSQQGDKEKSQGITDVLPMFDREKNADLAKSQIGFMEFVTLPFYALIVEKLFPDMAFALNQLKINKDTWVNQPPESPLSKSRDLIQ